MNYRFELQKYKTPADKHTCPQCNKNRCFVLYLDKTTNEPAGDRYGRCDHEQSCGYMLYPSSKKIPKGNFKWVNPPAKITSYHDINVIENHNYNTANNLIQKFCDIFPKDKVLKIWDDYKLGTMPHFGQNSMIFWQIDNQNRIRGGKVMAYNVNGKRQWAKDKEGNDFPLCTWYHKIKKIKDFQLRQCLFGEHLLRKNAILPVYVVESEKTALWGACKWGEKAIFVATGMLNGLNDSKIRALRGRDIILCPDVGRAADVWCFGWLDKQGKRREPKIKEIERVAKSVIIAPYIIDEKGKEGDDIIDIFG